MRNVYAPFVAVLLAGCATAEVATFQPISKDQTAVVRDGRQALLSQKKGSVVLVRQAARETPKGARPAYVIAILNPSAKPLNFTFADLSVTQTVGGQDVQGLKT